MKKRRRKALIVGVVTFTGVLMIGLLLTGIVQWKKHRNREEAMKIEAYHNELFGENVYIFSPEDDPAKVNDILADIYAKQETLQKNARTTVSQSEESSGRTFITLSDLFFRVGGMVTANPTKTKCCVTINSNHVIGDNFWVWRADHGDQVAWDKKVL